MEPVESSLKSYMKVRLWAPSIAITFNLQLFIFHLKWITPYSLSRNLFHSYFILRRFLILKKCCLRSNNRPIYFVIHSKNLFSSFLSPFINYLLLQYVRNLLNIYVIWKFIFYLSFLSTFYHFIHFFHDFIINSFHLFFCFLHSSLCPQHSIKHNYSLSVRRWLARDKVVVCNKNGGPREQGWITSSKLTKLEETSETL